MIAIFSVDGEYKQKSVTQTPSGHLSTTSEAEISCKPLTDELGAYKSNKVKSSHSTTHIHFYTQWVHAACFAQST